MKISREGIVLIKSFEGFRPRAVRDEDGGWVIGYGHTLSAREGLTVSEQDAELLLQYDLLPVVKALNEGVSAPLNQHQFDALASFAISVGVERFLASDVLQRLNEGHAGEAADALIGWPEETPPDARLRRRAAERALFVADPASPMHLADLLAAPLPPPRIAAATDAEAGEPISSNPPADARAAAVAALLGEPSDTPAGAIDEAAEPDPEAPAFEPTPFEAESPVTTVHLQRYAPYAAVIVGPLPGFPVLSEVPPQPAPEPTAELATPETVADPTPEPDPAEVESLDPFPAVAAPSPVVPLVPPEPGVSPFPPMDASLVLTPATEADFADAPRPIWEPEQRVETAPAPDETVLFEEEPTASVLRHEVEPAAPRQFDWGVTGAFLIMGVTGLTACAAAAAAFRKAMLDESSLNDYTVIGWVLALIGVICVGVSSWNLYVRWGRRD
nr:glycoside hydrolase family protein [Brevundimonas alba]